MTIDAETAAAACLLALANLSFVDGILIHLWRERLPFRRESRVEHVLHTLRAALFPIILVTFFTGAARTAGLVLLAVDQVVELADMAIERRSRAYSGGLRSSEYLVHGVLLTLRGAAIAFALLAPPSDRSGLWSIAGVVDVLVPGAIVVAALHVALIAAPFLRSRAAA